MKITLKEVHVYKLVGDVEEALMRYMTIGDYSTSGIFESLRSIFSWEDTLWANNAFAMLDAKC